MNRFRRPAAQLAQGGSGRDGRRDDTRLLRPSIDIDRAEFERLRDVWYTMIKRCHNPSADVYNRYGGRGIVVCERWRNSLDAFLEDMGPRPTSSHSLDRRENDGPYSPDNCRWATWSEQARNRRNNVLVTAFGVTRCLTEWAEVTGIKRAAIERRLQRGWAPERAVSEPSRPPRKLSLEKATLIRNLSATGVSKEELRDRFDLSRSQLNAILRWDCWRSPQEARSL
jgi:hypothetical protein